MTQGTIFSCVRLERYENCEVHGLVITARCDVAQQKFPILSFVPVVRFEDWLRRDGLDMLMNMEESSQTGDIKEILRQAGLSDALWEIISLADIGAKHFSSGNTKPEKNLNKRFEKQAELIAEFQKLKETGDQDLSFEWFQKNRKKNVAKLVSRLFEHDVSGHYLLETLTPQGIQDADELSGYVCLLREVGSLPKIVAEKLQNGLGVTEYNECGEGSSSHACLDIAPDALAMPIVVVTSPTIEHILQCFSHLFGRIGVADPDKTAVARLTAQSQEA